MLSVLRRLPPRSLPFCGALALHALGLALAARVALPVVLAREEELPDTFVLSLGLRPELPPGPGLDEEGAPEPRAGDPELPAEPLEVVPEPEPFVAENTEIEPDALEQELIVPEQEPVALAAMEPEPTEPALESVESPALLDPVSLGLFAFELPEPDPRASAAKETGPTGPPTRVNKDVPAEAPASDAGAVARDAASGTQPGAAVPLASDARGDGTQRGGQGGLAAAAIGGGGGSSAPRALEAPAPRYPRLSVRAGEEGNVVCRLHISAAGAVTEVEVVESSGHERLDSAARTTLLAWRFEPRSAASTVRHTVKFQLES